MAKKIGVRTATTAAAGVVKVGDGLTVAADGTLSASGGSDVDIISPTTVGTGTKPAATGSYSIAIGANSSAGGNAYSGVAIGYSTAVTGVAAVALGNGAKASGWGAVALGTGSAATGQYELSLGNDTVNRLITHVSTPTAPTDAATKGYVDGQTILANVTDSAHFDTDNSQVRIGYVNGAYHVVSGCLITKKIGSMVTIAQIPLDVDAVTTASLPTAYFTGLCFSPNSDSLDSAGDVFRYAMKLGRTSAGKLCIDFVNGGAAIGGTYQESITF